MRDKKQNQVRKVRPTRDYKMVERGKNALKIGRINKDFYVCSLFLDEEGKEQLEIHTLKGHEGDSIEYVPQEIVFEFFKKIIF